MYKALTLSLTLIVICSTTAVGQWSGLSQMFSQIQFLDDSSGFGVRVYPDLASFPLYTTTNAGASWQVQDSTSFFAGTLGTNMPTSFHFLSATHGFVFVHKYSNQAQGSGIEETVDGGRTWNEIYPNVRPFTNDSRYLTTVGNGRFIFATAAYSLHLSVPFQGLFVYRSKDQGGLPCDLVLDGSKFIGYTVGDIRSYDQDAVGNAIAVLQDTAGRSLIVRKLYPDTTWTILNVLDTSAIFFGYATEIKYVGGQRWEASTDSGIYSSSDLGAHWMPVARTSIRTTHLSFGSGGRGYATFQKTTRYILATRDSGKSWQREALPLLTADSLKTPVLGGSHTAAILGTSGPWPDASWINRSANAQRRGWLYLNSIDTFIGVYPKNDSSVHRLLVRNDDTTSWNVLNVTGDNPHLSSLDSNLTVLPGDSAFVRYTFSVLTSVGEGVHLTITTDDPFTSPLKVRIDARAKLPHLRIISNPTLATLQLGQTIIERSYLYNDGTDSLRITAYQPSSSECNIIGTVLKLIAAGIEVPLDVSIHPVKAGLDSGIVVVHSNAESASLDTIAYHLYVASDRVNTSWSLVRPAPNDTGDSFAKTLALAGDGKLLVGIQGADQTLHQDMILDEYDSSGSSMWSRVIHGTGAGSDVPWQIVTDGSQNIYFSGILRNHFASATDFDNCVLTSFDKQGTFRWADTLGHDSNVVPFRTLVLPNSQIIEICHGYGWYVHDAAYDKSEVGQIGVFWTNSQNSHPSISLINGTSQLFLDAGNSGYEYNLDDYPIAAELDGVGGFYLLNSFDKTDTSIWYQPPFYVDKRENRLSHFSVGQLTSSWSTRVEGSSMYVDQNGNAMIIGDSLTKVDVNGNIVNERYFPAHRLWVRSPDADLNTYNTNIGITRYSESRGLLWQHNYNSLILDDRTYANERRLPCKLLTDAANNVYIVATAQQGSNSIVVVLKYDSLGTLRWITSHGGGSTRDTALDAVLDHHGPIYVCGGTADSLGKYRPLIWKIEQDPVPGAVETPMKPAAQLQIFPNPFTKSVIATVPNSIEAPFDYSVIDVLGRKVACASGVGNRTITVSGGGLANGVYLLRVQDHLGNVAEKKLIRER